MDPVSFRTFQWPSSHHPSSVLEHFLQPQKILVPVLQVMPTPSLHPRPPWIWLLVPFPEVSYKWNHTISSFCLLLPGLSIIFLRLIYAAVQINRNTIINVILWLMFIVSYGEIPACLEITLILPSFRGQRVLISYILVSYQFPFTFCLFSHLPLFFPPEKFLSGFCNP